MLFRIALPANHVLVHLRMVFSRDLVGLVLELCEGEDSWIALLTGTFSVAVGAGVHEAELDTGLGQVTEQMLIVQEDDRMALRLGGQTNWPKMRARSTTWMPLEHCRRRHGWA